MYYNAKACRNACVDYYNYEDLVGKYTEIFLEKAKHGYMNCTIRNVNKVEEIKSIIPDLQALGFTLFSTGVGIFIDWSGDYDTE